MKLEVDLGQKFNILGVKVSLFTIIVLVVLSLLICRMCFKKYQTEEKFSSHEHMIKAYNFNTSWCGYSVKFQDEWNKFTSAAGEVGVVAHDIKCDNDENNEICKKYGEMYLPEADEPVVTGFPTVVFEVPGQEHPIVYPGNRTSDGLIEFSKSLSQ